MEIFNYTIYMLTGQLSDPYEHLNFIEMNSAYVGILECDGRAIYV